MTRPGQNKTPFRIATLCGGVAALLTATLLFAGTIKGLLVVIGLITSLSVGLLVYLILRRNDPDFESDYLEMLFQLSKDETVEQAQKDISKALFSASRRNDSVFQTLLETQLANIADDINQLGKGRIEFANTESWRVFYEQLLRCPKSPRNDYFHTCK